MTAKEGPPLFINFAMRLCRSDRWCWPINANHVDAGSHLGNPVQDSDVVCKNHGFLAFCNTDLQLLQQPFLSGHQFQQTTAFKVCQCRGFSLWEWTREPRRERQADDAPMLRRQIFQHFAFFPSHHHRIPQQQCQLPTTTTSSWNQMAWKWQTRFVIVTGKGVERVSQQTWSQQVCFEWKYPDNLTVMEYRKEAGHEVQVSATQALLVWPDQPFHWSFEGNGIHLQWLSSTGADPDSETAAVPLQKKQWPPVCPPNCLGMTQAEACHWTSGWHAHGEVAKGLEAMSLALQPRLSACMQGKWSEQATSCKLPQLQALVLICHIPSHLQWGNDLPAPALERHLPTESFSNVRDQELDEELLDTNAWPPAVLIQFSPELPQDPAWPFGVFALPFGPLGRDLGQDKSTELALEHLLQQPR